MFSTGPRDVGFTVSGVRVNVRLDAPIFEEASDGQGFSGGCVLIMASTDEARKNIDDRKKHVAALINWALEETSSRFEPLPRLCMSLDPYGGDVVRAPKAIDRLRSRLRHRVMRLPLAGTILNRLRVTMAPTGGNPHLG